MKKMVMLLLFCAALLTGCGDDLAKIKMLDDEIMRVREYPEEPYGDYKQDAVAEYVIKAKAAFQSCISTLESRKVK